MTQSCSYNLTKTVFSFQIASVTTSMVLTNQYIGYGIWSATIDANGMFFHSRDFIIAHDFPKSSFWFKLNSLLYKISFIVIRAPVLISLLVFLYSDRDRMHPFYYYFYTTGVCGLIVLNSLTFNKLAVKEKLS